MSTTSKTTVGTAIGTGIGVAIYAVSPLGWVAGGVAIGGALIGAIGDMFFDDPIVIPDVKIDVTGIPESWAGLIGPMNAYVKDKSNANGLSLSSNLLKIDLETHYQEKFSAMITGTDYKKVISLLPSKWEKLINDGLSQNPETVKYSDISEGIIGENTTEDLVALSTEELAEKVEDKLTELYPNAMTIKQMNAYLSAYSGAKNVIIKISNGWAQAGTQVASLEALIHGIRGSCLASESVYESNVSHNSTERTRYSQLVRKVNKLGASEGLVSKIRDGVDKTTTLNTNLDTFYKFVLRELKARGVATLRAFDSSRVSAINEKYVGVISKLNDKHKNELIDLQTKWQAKFDAQTVKHEAAMLLMKEGYEKVIKGLNETIEKYKVALDNSISLLTRFSEKLEGKSAAELKSIQDESASMVETTADIRNYADTVRTRDYSVGTAQAALTDNASVAARLAEEARIKAENERNATFMVKYKPYFLPVGMLASFLGYKLYTDKTRNDSVEGGNRNT